MKKFNVSISLLFLLGSYGMSAFAVTPTPPVKIVAWGAHQGGQVIYKYRIYNLGINSIDRIGIGFYPPTSTADGAAEFTVAPYYPGDSMWLPLGVSQSPAGWGVKLDYPEESATFLLDWVEASYYRGAWPRDTDAGVPIAQNPPNIMPPGATWEQFSVTVLSQDDAYVTGHANLFYGEDELTIPLEKGDATPPTLTVTLSPNLVVATNQLHPVTATIAVTDNYDPQPEIKLESIIVSEVSGAGDVGGAAIGTDDRQFQLMGSLAGSASGQVNPKGGNFGIPTAASNRIYTVTYSATDGSGNRALASALVTVQPNYIYTTQPVQITPPPRPSFWRWWRFW